MSQYFNSDLVVSEDASLFREVLELSLPSPSPTGELDSTFSGTLRDIPVQVTRQSGPPPFPGVPGPSSLQPQTTAIPLDNDARNRGACYDEGTGVRVWVTGGTHSPVAVPIRTPVSFAQFRFSKIC